MKQIESLADKRLLNGCIYCGAVAETRDHVPSRILLEPPYPENLPVVGACLECNQGFSKDEQYFACLLESVLAGATDPDKMMRTSIARTMRRSTALRNRIEAGRQEHEGQTMFAIEKKRIDNVILKLARGHAAYELDEQLLDQPKHLWYVPLLLMTEDERNAFNFVPEQKLYREIGSRAFQRMHFTEKNWIDVQEGYYRYLVLDMGATVVRIVISEYLASEVSWNLSDLYDHDDDDDDESAQPANG